MPLMLIDPPQPCFNLISSILKCSTQVMELFALIRNCRNYLSCISEEE